MLLHRCAVLLHSMAMKLAAEDIFWMEDMYCKTISVYHQTFCYIFLMYSYILDYCGTRTAVLQCCIYRIFASMCWFVRVFFFIKIDIPVWLFCQLNSFSIDFPKNVIYHSLYINLSIQNYMYHDPFSLLLRI